MNAKQTPALSPMALKAARVLSDYMADGCEVVRDDEWKTYSAELVNVAQKALDACGASDLLAALNAMLTHMGMDEDEWNKPTFDQARAAIAAAEGRTE